MSGISLYFLMLLGSLEGAAVIGGIICGLASLIAFVIAKVEDSEIATSVYKCFFKVFVVCAIWAIFVPNTKQALTLMAIPYATQNERIAKNVDKTIELFEATLDKKLKAVKEAQ